jgi:hypothetical protein
MFRGVLVASAWLFVVVSVQAQTSRAELAALRAELAALQDEVSQLRGEPGHAASAAALRGATDAAMQDAAQRISYQSDQLIAGHDGKAFILTDPEDNYALLLSGQAQLRYLANQRVDSGGDDGQQGFQLRRFKLKGKGHIADPKIGFDFIVAFNRDSNAAGLEAARLRYTFDNGVQVFAGRMKGPFAYEELMSSSRQLTVERSLVHEQFTIGYQEGLAVGFEPWEATEVHVMLSDGAKSGESGNGDFNESPADFAVTARAETTLGDDIAKDYSSWADDAPGLQLGVAVHHEVGQTGDGQTAATLDTFTRLTADALYNHAGFSAYLAGYAQTQDAPGAAAEQDPLGLLAQVAYNVEDTFEPFVRYEWIDLDAPGGDPIELITAGFNVYLKGHAAKFTLDGVYALDPLTGLTISDGLGLQTDAAGEDGQAALRAQFQLLW